MNLVLDKVSNLIVTRHKKMCQWNWSQLNKEIVTEILAYHKCLKLKRDQLNISTSLEHPTAGLCRNWDNQLTNKRPNITDY